MRSGPFAVAFVTLLLATGCAADAPADPGEVTPTPTDEVVVPQRPASQFPGECDDFVPAALLVAVGGASALDASESSSTAADAAAAEQAGTLSCIWLFTASGDEGDELGLLLRRHADVLVPALHGGGIGYPGGVTADLAADSSSIVCSEYQDRQSCQIAFVVGDYLGMAHLEVTTSAALGATTASFTSAISAAVDRLRAEPVPAAWEPAVDAWSIPVDCAAIIADGSLASAVGWTAAGVVNEPEMGVQPRVGLGESTECPLRNEGGDGGFIAILTAGGAWVWDDFAALPGVVEIEVEGAEHAAILCDGSPGSCQAFAVVGANCVTAIGSSDFGTGTSEALATRLEASLRGLVAGASSLP